MTACASPWAFIALGGNLSSPWGQPADTLRQACHYLKALSHTPLVISPFYSTPPLTQPGSPDTPARYCNAVVALPPRLSPEPLMAQLLAIERAAGRVRDPNNRYASRTLDLDLLAYGTLVCNTPLLTLPHPHAHTRAFVLVPWADVVQTLLKQGTLNADWPLPLANSTVMLTAAHLPKDDLSRYNETT